MLRSRISYWNLIKFPYLQDTTERGNRGLKHAQRQGEDRVTLQITLLFPVNFLVGTRDLRTLWGANGTCQPLPFLSYREKGERRPSSGTRAGVGDSPGNTGALFRSTRGKELGYLQGLSRAQPALAGHRHSQSAPLPFLPGRALSSVCDGPELRHGRTDGRSEFIYKMCHCLTFWFLVVA
jgi:hypothetical protein